MARIKFNVDHTMLLSKSGYVKLKSFAWESTIYVFFRKWKNVVYYVLSLSLQLAYLLYESFLSAVAVFIVSICQHEGPAAEEMKPHDISMGSSPSRVHTVHPL